MKNILIMFLMFGINFNLYAITRLIYPEDLEIKELNTDEKDKFKSIKTGKSVKDNSTLGMPEQYKGPLKFTEPEQEAYLKDYRISIGFGGSASIFQNISMITSTDFDYSKNPKFDIGKSQNWETPKINYNYNASIGLYWVNGVRLEFEYKKATVEISKFTDGFKTTCKGDDYSKQCTEYYLLNVYKQKAGVITQEDREDVKGEKIPALTKNMQPLVNLSVSTYMANVIFEQVYVKSKIRPYLGIAIGVANVNINSLETLKNSYVPSIQPSIGLSYPVSDGKVVLYIGYKGLFMPKITQTIKKIIGTSEEAKSYCQKNSKAECNSDGIGYGKKNLGYYYDPIFENSEQEYNTSSHEINVTARFYF